MTRRRILMDLTPLSVNRDFARLWIGQGMSAFGGELTVYAVILYVHDLTGSALAVGGVGLAFAAPSPAVVLLLAGSLDRYDRRIIVLVASSGQAVVSVLLAVQAYTGTGGLFLLYTLVAVQGALAAVNAPARDTFAPRLIPRHLRHSAAALEALALHGATVLGPPVAGLVAARWDVRVCFLIDAVTFVAALHGVYRLPSMRVDSPAGLGPRATAEAVRFLGRTPIVAQVFLTDMAITLLGIPTALLPGLNDGHYGGDPSVLGLMLAAPAAGGLIGSACSGLTGRAVHQGRLIPLLLSGWGVAVTALTLRPPIWLLLVLLAWSGTLGVLTAVIGTAIVQNTTPDALLGRINALGFLSRAAGPRFGSFRAGALGSLIGVGGAIAVGGLSTLAAALALRVAGRSLRAYRKDTDDRADIASDSTDR